jgi:hypothetical protein
MTDSSIPPNFECLSVAEEYKRRSGNIICWNETKNSFAAITKTGPWILLSEVVLQSPDVENTDSIYY